MIALDAAVKGGQWLSVKVKGKACCMASLLAMHACCQAPAAEAQAKLHSESCGFTDSTQLKTLDSSCDELPAPAAHRSSCSKHRPGHRRTRLQQPATGLLLLQLLPSCSVDSVLSR